MDNSKALSTEFTVSTIVEKFSEFANAEVVDKEEVRQFINEAQKFILTLPQIEEPPLKHHFSRNLYGREFHCFKGQMIVGKIHKHQTMNVISKGDVTVLSIDGVVRMKAPFTFVSSPGAKRLLFVNEDTVWSTFHATTETDLEKIEADVIAENYDEVVELPQTEGEKCLTM